MRDQFLAVFDLDYTVWEPEMYQLWGSPRLVPTPSHMSQVEQTNCRTVQEDQILTDRQGSPIRVFPGASHALVDINQLQGQGRCDIRAAAASKTDEPEYAVICMKHLQLPDGRTLQECFGELVEIEVTNKQYHLKRLQKKTGIPFDQMVFFDNEGGNIRSVKSLGVHCIYTPNGMEKKHWTEAKRLLGIQDL